MQGGFEHEIEVEGHLIDSMILSRIFDKIMDLGGEFEVEEFRIGKKKHEASYAKLLVRGRDETHLKNMIQELHLLGAISVKVQPVKILPSPEDRVLPEGFYSTTNHPTSVYLGGEWVEVEDLMMDKAIVIDPQKHRAVCKPPAEVRRGELVVVGDDGIKVKLPERPREGVGIFEFMGSTASSEKPLTSIIARVAQDIHRVKKEGGRIVVVAGPAVIHTGASDALERLIRYGYVDALLAGNALAVHDVEAAIHGTSLGVSLKNGTTTLKGHRNHMSAINEIFRAGSLRDAVKAGVVRMGVMYECIANNIPYALAASIRDDGPLPDVTTDMVEAQRQYKALLKGADIVVMLSTMLHSIAVGNMLPSTVRIICVDINPPTITKLLDRGTKQALGIVSDVGTFLPLLVEELERIMEIRP